MKTARITLRGNDCQRAIIDLQSGSEESLVISAPRYCYFPFREARMGHIRTDLRSALQRSHGAGDLTDFESSWIGLASLGGSVAATLPLLAAFLDEPFEPKSVSPASRLFWNEFFISTPKRVPNSSTIRRAPAMMSSRPLGYSKLVDYRAGMASDRLFSGSMSRIHFLRDAGRRARVEDSKDSFARLQSVTDYASLRAVTDRLTTGLALMAPTPAWWSQLEPATTMRRTTVTICMPSGSFRNSCSSLSERARSAGNCCISIFHLGVHPTATTFGGNRQFFL